jgi:hypothetical protein
LTLERPLTKTLFVAGTRCSKLMYYLYHFPKEIPKDSLGAEFRKKHGNIVGEAIKGLFPEALDISREPDQTKLILTKENKDKIIFEASVEYNNLFARADVLFPNKDGTFDIIEVKSDTKVKDEHIPDVSFQKYVFQKAGYNINKCYLLHINNEYVREEKLDLEQLFKKDDITEKISEFNTEVIIKQLLSILEFKEIPKMDLGRYCLNPYECSLKKECWKDLPDNNVTQLFYDKNLGYKLLEQGIKEIKQIPDNLEIKGRCALQRTIQIEATKQDKIHIQKQQIKEFIDNIKYPIYYFDFETYAPAIPIFNNSRPYQQIPFQFSLHIEHQDGTIEHKEFLSTTKEDPRIELIKKMKEYLGDKGDILVYNKSFEQMIIRDLQRDFPEFRENAQNYLERLSDLAEPFKNFHYYDPKQLGRYSIKAVLPVMSDLSYKGMVISNGEEAFINYEKIIQDLVKDKEKEDIITALKEYCKQDTYAEIVILKKLKDLLDC